MTTFEVRASEEFVIGESSALLKRGLDILAASAGLIVSSPLLLVIGIGVRLDGDRNAVIFRQQRVGRHGVSFTMHKFRSMRSTEAGPLISTSVDPRITRFGGFLRRTKLDELPQLYDVLIGRMSLVGPRPEVERYVRLWPTASQPIILSVRPGITDPASVKMRHESEELAAAADPERHYTEVILPQKAAMYVDYVRRQSLVGDLRIIGATLVALFR